MKLGRIKLKDKEEKKWLHRLRHWIAVTPMSTHSWIIVTIILKIYIIIMILPCELHEFRQGMLGYFPKKSHQSSLCYCFSSKTPAKAELLIYQHSIVLSLPGWYRAVPVVTFQEEIQRKLNFLIIPKTTRTTSQAALRVFFYSVLQLTLCRILYETFSDWLAETAPHHPSLTCLGQGCLVYRRWYVYNVLYV